MIYILQIDTATTNCSVAISKNGKTIALKEVSNGYSHAENLHVFVEEILKESALSFSDLSAIAVSKGPGSYTGLRIGVSAVKGWSFALNIPLIALETLEVIAHQTDRNNGFVIPMIDARRMEAYTRVYDYNYNEVRSIEAQVLDEDSFLSYLEKGEVVFIGNKTEKIQGLIKHENAIFIDSLPSAKEMSSLSYEKYNNNDFEDVAYFEPYYLKDFLVTPEKKKI
ncbi:tRNA (adenosine(37)-N6)-threonylcarbamoyltransferase complex dimerization subunit type 1 TsaB [Pseudofulvibacter geojedonensis]|uniref:tRNA (Adenosine(37)-N6)-threonylcarbamoyltransferase complex dimerization subunit type 1 TsaB n=1 Tax=Pseudofulvibacter geojedonensis TaxID=1123758 RepID=A0ABW3I225_9FLAO